MTAHLNHTIVWSSDRTKSARFLAEMLGRPEPAPVSAELPHAGDLAGAR
jgi:hypothetical protein